MTTGTAERPSFRDAYSEGSGNDYIRGQYFAYRADLGLVAGQLLTVAFELDAPRSVAWQSFKDWNVWMNAGSYYVSGVVGDLAGKTFRIGLTPDDLDGEHQYRVDLVMPEYAIVITQPEPEGGYSFGSGDAIGLGGISAGFTIQTLEEVDGKTRVNIHMQHASVMADPAKAGELGWDEIIEPWKESMEAARPRWRDQFIPALRKAVAEGVS